MSAKSEQKFWRLAHGRSLPLGDKSLIMGILNATPDSFSDGGRFIQPDEALQHVERMIGEGADIIDIGGESTRPGADPVTADEEQARILPLIEAVSKHCDVAISVDTYRADTARLAIQAGAHIVNDVWGLQKEPDIAKIAAKTGAGLVIMHTGRDREPLDDMIEDQRFFLTKSLEIARLEGIADHAIMLDPGFGFAKDTDQNCALMRRFGELMDFWPHWLIGTSRKRFIGALNKENDPTLRDAGTAATSVALRLAGARAFRVHDVAMNRRALDIADAIVKA